MSKFAKLHPTNHSRRMRTRRKPVNRRALNVRTMRFEALEVRNLMARVFWNIEGPGDWDVASNWRDEVGVSRVPNSNDDVFLDKGSTPFEVRHRQGNSTVLSIHSTTNSLVLSGGSMQFSINSSLAGNFELSGGELYPANGAILALSGQASWQGGAIHGGGRNTAIAPAFGVGGILNTGILNISGNGSKILGGVLSNAGTIAFQSSTPLLMEDLFNFGATGWYGSIDNRSGGTVEFQSNASLASPHLVKNSGVLRKTLDVNSLTISALVDQQGSIEVTAGTLVLPSASYENTGFSASSGSRINLTGNSTVKGTIRGAGSGQIEFSGSRMEAQAGGANFAFNGPLFVWTGDLIDGGVDGITNLGTITLAGTTLKRLNGKLFNRGIIAHGGTQRLGHINGEIINESKGIYDIQGDLRFDGSLTNRGTFRKSAGSGVTVIPGNFSNELGTIEVATGTIQISQSFSNGPRGLNTGGTFHVHVGASLDLSSDGSTVAYSGSYRGVGGGQIRLSSGTIQVAQRGATFAFADRMMQWSGGTISGGTAGLNNVGTIDLVGSSTKTLSGKLINVGTVTHGGTGALFFQPTGPLPAGTQFVNQAGALYDMQGDLQFTQSSGPNGFVNAGTFRKSAGFGSASFGSLRLENQLGTIDVRSGTLILTKGSESKHTGGTFLVSSGATLEIAGGDSFTSHTFTGTYRGSGNGKIKLTSGVITIGSEDAAFAFAPEMFQWTDGNIDARAGKLTNLGTMTIPSLGFQRLRGTLENSGTFRTLGDTFLTIGGDSGLGHFNNLATGIYEIQGDGGGISQSTLFGNGSRFTNAGTLRKTSGAGTASIGTTVAFSNAGTLEVLSGTLNIDSTSVEQVSGQSLIGGSWTVKGNSLLNLSAVPSITNNAAEINLAGPNARFIQAENIAINRGAIHLSEGRDWSVGSSVVLRSFNPGLGLLVGVALDPATSNLLVYPDFDSTIYKFTSSGQEVLPRIARPGASSANFDLEITTVPVTIGTATVPAGSLLVINSDNNPKTIYALDKNTGNVLASRSLTLAGKPVGASYHPSRGTLYVVEFDTDQVREVDLVSGAVLQSFSVRPAGSPVFEVNYGDITCDPVTGNLIIASDTQNSIRELTPTGQFVRDLPLNGISKLSGLAIDPATGNLWVSTTTGLVAEISRASFVNAGTLSLGAGSTFTTAGNWTQTADGQFNASIGGAPASNNFGKVVSGGLASLAGSFKVDLTNGYGPTASDTFSVISYPQHTGQFSNVEGLQFGRFPLFKLEVLSQQTILTSQTTAADLSFTSFDPNSFPSSAAPGQSLTLNYTVQNLSEVTASANWIDSVYLSLDDKLDENDPLLTRVTHTSNLAGRSAYRESISAQLPSLVDGSYHIIVLVDSRGMTPDSRRENNLGVSVTKVSVGVTPLEIGVPVDSTVLPSQDRYYRLTLPPGQDIALEANFANIAGELYVRRDALPDRANFDQRATAGSMNAQLLLSNTQGGTYYILVRGREDAESPTGFKLTAKTAGFSIIDFYPKAGSFQSASRGKFEIQVTGAKFTPFTNLSISRPGGETRQALSVRYQDANHLNVTFDLTDLPLGAYSLMAVESGKNTTAVDTFEVKDAPAGLLSIIVSAPQYVRTGALFPVRAELINTSDVPAFAPFIHITATNVAAGQESRSLLAGADQLPGMIPPRTPESLPPAASLDYTPKPVGNHVVSTLNAAVLNPTNTSIDWESQKDSLRPATMAQDAWDAVWLNLKPRLGLTLAQLFEQLRTDALALAQVGPNIDSISRLVAFEVERANGGPAMSTAPPAIDLAVAAPGLPLIVARDFGLNISGRYREGRLGRGWSDNWDRSIREIPDMDLIEVSLGGAVRFFTDLKNGNYRALNGGLGTLNKVGDHFELREATGEITVFGSDRKWQSIQDNNGNRVSASYTAGRLTSVTHTNGESLSFSYNTAGLISRVDASQGRYVSYSYDATNTHLVQVTNNDGTTGYGYTSDADGPKAHAITSLTRIDGTHQFFQYDSEGRLVDSQGDGGIGRLRIVYDTASYRITNASNQTTIFYFNDQFGVQLIRDPLGRLLKARLDSQGRPAGIGIVGGGDTEISYDERGMPNQVINTNRETVNPLFEPTHNRLDLINDALGNLTDFTYDDQGNLVSTEYADGTKESYGYDSNGNITLTRDRMGQAIAYQYDAKGMLRGKSYPDGTQFTYAYDARGNMLSASGPSGTTSMTYDAADRMIHIEYPGGLFLDFGYDSGGRRTFNRDQSGFTVKYAYNNAGLLSDLKDAFDNTFVHYDYDSTGRVSLESRANGTTTEYAYEADNRIQRITHRDAQNAIQSQFVYTYDALGQRQTMTTLEGTTTYGYDPAGRLIHVEIPGGRVIDYVYDAMGNRQSVTDGGVATNYSVNNLNQYTSIGQAIPAYDAEGNLLSGTTSLGRSSYQYDVEGRLIRQIAPDGVWTYEYDALGNRIASTHNGVRKEYLIDPAGLGNVVGEYDGNGSLLARYAYGLGLESRFDSTNLPAYYGFDGSGNTSIMTDVAGDVANAYSYLPFGESLSIREEIANPFEFVGQFGVLREGSGIDSMRNRWYEPSSGRFTQADKIGIAGGLNLYAYANNDPVSLADPTGSTPAIAALGMAQTMWVPAVLLPTPLAPELAAARELAAMTSEGIASEATLAAAEAAIAAMRGTAAIAPSVAPTVLLPAAPTAAPVVSLGIGSVSEAGLYGLLAYEYLVIGNAIFQLNYAFLGGIPPCTPGIPKSLQACDEIGSTIIEDIVEIQFRIVKKLFIEQIKPSEDPNDLSGEPGFGPERFMRPEGSLPYVINFENIPTALGPAAEVIVSQHLDDELDLNTFELGSLGFGDITVDVPSGLQAFSTRLDLTATRGVLVDVRAELNRLTRDVIWRLTAIDPTTLDLPIDPFTGFLPPDKVSPEGQGHVTYFVRPKSNVTTGTVINAQATIVFDTNDPIDTNVWHNTIDAGPPVSNVEPLPAISSSADLTVHWSGVDDANGVPGSGIATFDIYVSVDGSPYELWLDDTSVLAGVYHGQDGHRYGFAAVATDQVGYNELDPLDFLHPESIAHIRVPIPGVTITPSSELITTESGGTATFQVALQAPPISPVTILMTSNNTSEGQIPASIVFTTANWDVPQVVTVTGQDDSLVDGDQTYNVTFQIQSSDSRYATLTPPSALSLVNHNNDSPLVDSLQIDDGTKQRSRVSKLVVTFNGLVTIATDAISLVRTTDNLPITIVSNAVNSNGRTTVTITFSGSGTEFGSLADGNYRLTVRKNKVQAGLNAFLQEDRIDSFFRFFGDSDGDRDVDNADYLRFRGGAGKRTGEQGYLSYLDFDGDGDIDDLDQREFLKRKGKRLN